MTIYKTFLRPLIDYGDIIYDQPQNESLQAVIAITGAIYTRHLL